MSVMPSQDSASACLAWWAEGAMCASLCTTAPPRSSTASVSQLNVLFRFRFY